jgi:hypothetical protein
MSRGSADVLAEEFQPAEDVDVAPSGGEVETVAIANIAVGGIAVVRPATSERCPSLNRSAGLPRLR